MGWPSRLKAGLVAVVLLLGTGAGTPDPLSDSALARSLPGDFRSEHAEVNGTRLHYVAGGKGEPLVLLPGWPQTWWQYRKVMPELAKSYRVIAVDLRGMGGSAKPASGYDKKTMAADIHELIKKLGHPEVNVAGHDIGAMVAHSLAANHPAAVRRLALLDVPHPDESLRSLTLLPDPKGAPHLWWFAFNQVQGLPEQLVSGRSRAMLDWLLGRMLKDQASVEERARQVFARAYSSPDAIRGGNGWYQTFNQDIEDVKTYPKVSVPVLGLVNDSLGHDGLSQVLPKQATNFRVVPVARSGHYLAEEQPRAVLDELRRFFG
ncbi:alpha/beta fold hydrolase [Allokutzneria albata]|uniref:Pimeloyl-ACP methyl ester carboxylesterase n=1 Tax=Allokutzneria albata TaxID=211114 RepID=A0A1G9SXV3_ALLAB|nr:alpha/beta hydrolase [Allokutzneria albata]SDM40147.1 Pimeloyl-ACP methyl ester carboxylesterase [Allokutzneria albata]